MWGFAIPARATQITWTNTRNGNWEGLTNWSPRQIPGPGDIATINDTVTITVTANESVSNLNLTSGTLVGSFPLLVSSQCNLTNATVALPLEIAGEGFCSQTVDLSGITTVDTNAILTLTNVNLLYLGDYDQNQHLTNRAVLVNNGTVLFKPSNFIGILATIQNSGDWEDLGNESLGGFPGTNSFLNFGIYNKSVGTGTTTFGTQWLFTTTGTINTESGLLALDLWSGSNVLNGVLDLANSSLLPGATLEVATNATLNWSAGTMGGAMVVDPGGFLVLSNSSLAFGGSGTNGVSMTNYGVVTCSHSSPSFSTTIVNAGLWQDLGTNSYNVISAGRTNYFINTGSYQKTGGTNASSFVNGYFNSTGTIDTYVGSLNVGNWAGTNVLNGILSQSGGNLLGSASLEVASNSFFNWQAGDMSGLLTIDPGGTMISSNRTATLTLGALNLSQHLTNVANLVNNGVVAFTNTAITGYNAVIQNAGQWISSSNSFALNNGSSGSQNPIFINNGFWNVLPANGASFNIWSVTNNGTLIISGELATTLTQTGGLTELQGGTLEPFGTFVLLGGTLMGTGQIVGNVTNSATISAGLPVGLLNIQGNYGQSPSGVMNVFLTGSQPGVETSEITAVSVFLNGRLNVFLTNNFLPDLNTDYTIINSPEPNFFSEFNSLSDPIFLRLGILYSFPQGGPVSVYFETPAGTAIYKSNFVGQLMGMPGTNYTIETTSTLSPPDWQKWTNVIAQSSTNGISGVIQIIDPAVATNRFYRAVTPAY